MTNSNSSSTTSNERLRRDSWRERSRRDPDDGYAWLMAHRRLRGQPLLHLPALEAIARDDHPFVVVQKSAQTGLTELFVGLAFWAAATTLGDRGNVLFLMPQQNQMDDFAQARFDRAIEESPDLQRLLQPLTGKAADRLRLKRVGDGHIFLRGADNANQVASVDADLVLLDEYDQMPDGTLERAETRLASSAQGRLRIASTPRFPEAGINGLFLQSDQRRYHLPCPACGEEQPLRFAENVDLQTPAIVCRACRAPLDVTQPGRWVAEAPANTRIRGYHLSRLYSPWLDLERLVAHSERVGPAGLQDFQNSDLGEVFSAPNSGLTLDMLDRNRDDYSLDDYAGEPCMMGVDVGIKFHVVIRETAPNGTDPERRHQWRRRRCWFAGTVDTIAEVEALIDRFRVQRCIIDSLPETHIVGPFARRHPEVVRLARYGRQEPSHEFRKRDGGIPATYHFNRTLAIDETVQTFQDEVALLPRDARELCAPVRDGIGEYYRELQAAQRLRVQDAQGNWVARWEEGHRDDHFLHAELYAYFAEIWFEPPESTFVFAITSGRPSGPSYHWER